MRIRHDIPIEHPCADVKIHSQRFDAQQQLDEPGPAVCGNLEQDGRRVILLAAVAVQAPLPRKPDIADEQLRLVADTHPSLSQLGGDCD